MTTQASRKMHAIPRLATRQIADPVIDAANRSVISGRLRAEPARCAEFRIDWVQVSLPERLVDDTRAFLEEISGHRAVEHRVPQEQAYRRGEAIGNVRLYSSHRYRKPTACLVISGSAKPHIYLEIVARLVAAGAHITRIDLAFDVPLSMRSLEAVEAAWRTGTAVSRFRTMQTYATFIRDGSQTGRTAMFGSRRSDVCLRVYERNVVVEEPGAVEETGTVVRWELEAKNEVAHNLALEVLAEDPDSGWPVLQENFPNDGLVAHFRQRAIELLVSRLSFRGRDVVSNVSRAPVEPWWLEFVAYLDGEKDVVQTPQQPDDPEDSGPLVLNILSWEELELADEQRRSREIAQAELRDQGNALVFELFEDFRRAFGEFNGDARNDARYRPRLRVIHSTRVPATPSKPRGRLRLAATSLWSIRSRPPVCGQQISLSELASVLGVTAATVRRMGLPTVPRIKGRGPSRYSIDDVQAELRHRNPGLDSVWPGPEGRLLSASDVAEWLTERLLDGSEISSETFAKWRRRKQGPRPIQLAPRIFRYLVDDFKPWVEAGRCPLDGV